MWDILLRRQSCEKVSLKGFVARKFGPEYSRGLSFRYQVGNTARLSRMLVPEVPLISTLGPMSTDHLGCHTQLAGQLQPGRIYRWGGHGVWGLLTVSDCQAQKA